MNSCFANPRRFDFGNLRGADRIDIIGRGSQKLETVDDPAKIQAAVTFATEHQEGWIDRWSGPRAPTVFLVFYRAGRPVGDLGLATHYVTTGSISRDVPSTEIQTFAKELGLKWPLQDQK
jgi:hypothetical protein